MSFALTAKSPQKPPTAKRGIVYTLSCPIENCVVAMKGTLTIPSTRKGGKASKIKLSSSTVRVTRAKRKTHTFKLTRLQRARVARALRSARTRRGVKVVATGTARDAAGKRPSTKTKTVSIRR